MSDLAAAMDLMALSLRGGRGVTACLGEVATVLDEPLAGQMRRVCAGLAWGLAETEAWAAVPPAWGATRRALSLAAEAGVPPAGLIARAAADLRRQEEARLEEADGKLGVRLVIPLGLLFLPGFFAATVVPVIAALARELLVP